MSLNLVNRLNTPTTVQKAAPAQRKGTAKSVFTPNYLSKSGSIFSTPIKTNTLPTTLNQLSDTNVFGSLNQLQKETTPVKKAEATKVENIKGIDSASEGRAAISSTKNSTSQVRTKITEAKKDALTVNAFNSNSQKAEKLIEKEENYYKKQFEKNAADFKKENQKLEKLTKETEETQIEINDAQNELDSLLASSSFNINRGNNQRGSSYNQDRIIELQKFIGTKTTLVQANGKQIYSIQRSSQKSLKKMEKTNAAFVKANQQTNNTLNTQQKETSGIIKVATSIEEISQLVSTIGQAVNYAGVGLEALGTAMSGWFGAGAALIAVGKTMQKIGKIAETVGQYGVAAANVTKTAAYAAEGNIAGAMQSAALAVQSGTAAIKSTKDMGQTFKQIDAKADEAVNKLTAKTEAKNVVNSMKEETKDKLVTENGWDANNLTKEQKKQIKMAQKSNWGGMTEKEYRKARANTYETFLNANNDDITRQNALYGAKDRKRALEKMRNSEANTLEVRPNVIVDATQLQKDLKGISTDYIKELNLDPNNLYNQNGELIDKSGKVVDKKARKNALGKMKTYSNKSATNTVKNSKSWTDRIGQFQNGLTSAAALFANSSTSTSSITGNSTTQYAQWDLTQDARFMKIRNRRMRRTGNYY